MATLVLQRASWRLQISRTSRTFSISFTNALSHHSKSRRTSLYLDEQPDHNSSASRDVRHREARRAFTSSRIYQAQQAQAARSQPTPSLSPTSAPKPASTDAPRTPTSSTSPANKTQDLSSGLSDQPLVLDEGSRQVDWAHSFHGLSTVAFPKEAADVLLQPIPAEDIEVKPDGIMYLPEIKYRRILNKAFGPGGWGLAPRGETIVTPKAVTREYALVVLGRLVDHLKIEPRESRF